MRNDDISARITSTNFITANDSNTLEYVRNTNNLLVNNIDAKFTTISLPNNKFINLEVFIEGVISHLEKEKSPTTRRHKSTWRKRPGRTWSRGLYR